MTYIILYIAVAIWMFLDGKKREFPAIPYVVGTVLLGPIIAPIYFAKRYLKEGEVREGGTGWNVLKNFALFWTLTMLFVGIVGMVGASEVVSSAGDEFEQAGAAIGAGLGLIVLVFLWFVPMVSALVIGLFLKKASVIEKGPTGPLAK